jgi:hypothetical protein
MCICKIMSSNEVRYVLKSWKSVQKFVAQFWFTDWNCANNQKAFIKIETFISYSLALLFLIYKNVLIIYINSIPKFLFHLSIRFHFMSTRCDRPYNVRSNHFSKSHSSWRISLLFLDHNTLCHCNNILVFESTLYHSCWAKYKIPWHYYFPIWN